MGEDNLEGPGDTQDLADETDVGMSVMPWSSYASARAWVLTIVVGAVFALFEAVLGQFVSAGEAIAYALETAGGAFSSAGATVGDVVLGVYAIPFDLAAGLAANAGPFAPVLVAVAWALAAAGVGLLAYIMWRLFTWI